MKTDMSGLEKLAFFLVFLMATLQGFYAFYAFFDPAAFATLRGTDLLVIGDADWVKIYASRTLFIALILFYLLIRKKYKILKMAALFGTMMPVVDAFLAYQSAAPNFTVIKHVLTILYLLLTYWLLSVVIKRQQHDE